MADEPANKSMRWQLDQNDVTCYAGLALLGIGLAVSFSWTVALMVVGAVLVVVSTASAFAVVILSALRSRGK